MRNFDRPRNPIIGFIYPLVFALLYCICLGCVSYLLGRTLVFLVFLCSYLIGRYMLKYLEYYTLFHKILAAIYALIGYLFYWIAFIVCMLYQGGYPLIDAIKLIFTPQGLIYVIGTQLGLNLVFLIITPISAFCYLHFYGTANF